MNERLPIVDELGRELVRAARASQQRSAAGRARRAVVIGVLVMLGLGAVAAAATFIVGRGAPIPPARHSDVPPELRPVPGSARLNGLNVADPDGGPPWDVRTSRSQTGAVCATVGQVLDGELGLLGLDRRFRELPAGAADTCSSPQRNGATLAGARGFRGGGRLSALTVLNGVAAPGVRRVVAFAGGHATALRIGPGGAFLAVLRGLPEELRPRIVLSDASGRRTTLRFADSGEFIVADPSGGTPWALSYHRAAAGLRCVAAVRERGPDSPAPSPRGTFNIATASVPPRCGPRARPFVAIRRFVPEAPVVGPVRWGLNPARTVVWGAAPRGAGAVVVTGAGAARRLRTDGPRGGFALVLDGRVDPRALRVLVGGHPLDPDRALGTAGQAVHRVAVPAWRSVAAAARGHAAVEPLRPLAGTVAISARASDPTGGPGWALRTWTGRIDPHVRSDPRISRDLLCYAFGIERGDRLVEPVRGTATRTITTSGADARCNDTRTVASVAGPPEVRTYVDDPDAADPRPQRVVAGGLLGDGVRSAQLLGAGAPVDLSIGRHGTFLVVLGPEHAGIPLRVRQVRADGSVRTSASSQLGIECRPTPGRSVRVADPDGGPSWTAGSGIVSGRLPGPPAGRGRIQTPVAHGRCRYSGRLVGDRVATILPGTSSVIYEPMAFSTGLVDPSSRSPLQLTVQGPGFAPVNGETAAAPPTLAQVQRRTLPGRTIVSGTARGDVTSITLRTPRDVRTLRPGPGGAFLAVYDGAFYGGAVRATAHLRDGRSRTETFAPGAPPILGR